MLAALCLCLLQDPAPGPLDLQTEISRLADQVRQDFSDIYESFRKITDQMENPEAESLQDGLQKISGENEKLLTDIEALLAAIPESESDSPNDSSSSGKGQTQPNQPKPDPDPGKQPKPSQESPNGQTLPPELRSTLLLDTRPGAWGALPPRLQAALRQAVIEDMPLRYRSWLEEFHRRSPD